MVANLVLGVFVACFLSFSTVLCEKGLYFGCYAKDDLDPLLYAVSNDVDQCIDACENIYHRYAAIFDNECTCLNKIHQSVISFENCNTKCRTSPSQFCGGIENNTKSVYETGVELSGPVKNVKISTKPTENSITVAWDPPTAAGIPVAQYEVTAKVLTTYATFRVFSHSWNLQNNTNQFEMLNLQPGTSYNITITSISAKGSGGSTFILAETEIGIPDPEPEEPLILRRLETSILIEIKKGFSHNGPINLYRVVVHYIGDDILQNYDESLLKDFQKSKEDGTPYYIAAELEIKNESQQFTVGDGNRYRNYFNPPIPAKSHVHISIGVVSILNNVVKVRYASTTHHQHDGSNENVQILTFEQDMEGNQTLVIVLAVACVLFGLVLFGSIGLYVYLRFKKPIRVRTLSDHHELQLQGPILEVENNGYVPDGYERRNFNEELSTMVHNLNADRKLLRKLLTLDIDNIIGSGNYGDVMRGNLQRLDNDFSCQVHVVSDDMEAQHQITFLNDFKKIIDLESHPRLLQLYGVCVTPDWCYVIFEDQQITLKEKLLNARIPNNVNSPTFSSISEEMIINILCNVGEGMQYLAEKDIVNKKLCARSVYVNSNFEVKLSTFGPLLNGENNQQVDAIRWSSPEVLKFRSFSHKGDVWSFGLLIWECCCLGATPYGSITTDNLFYQIRSGSRPDKPSFVFDDLYQICLNCWDLEANERPNFPDMLRQLKQMMSMLRYVLSFERNTNIQLPPYLPHLEFKY